MLNDEMMIGDGMERDENGVDMGRAGVGMDAGRMK